MRFGRTDKNLAAKDKKLQKLLNEGESEEFTRASRDKSFMRFGRAKESSSGEDMDKRDTTSGENADMSYDQDKPQKIIYYRRDTPKNLMRFGRSNNFLRFGRGNPKANFLRFGRQSGADTTGFPRNSKMDKNFMRFGRSGSGPSALKSNLLKELLTEGEDNKDNINYDAVLDSIYDKN
jgi:hypothetical protein